MEEGLGNVDAIGKNVLIVPLTIIVSNLEPFWQVFQFCSCYDFHDCWQVKENEDVIAQITIVFNVDTIQIVDGDKDVVEEVVNIESANLIPIVVETRNALDIVAIKELAK